MGKVAIMVNDFDKGRKTVIKMEDVTVIISREKGAGGYDMIHINIDDEVDIKKWARKTETLSGAPVRNKEKRGNYTAGQPPYAMVHGDRIREKLASPSCAGNGVIQKAAILDLSSYIEMGTGRLRKGWRENHRKGDESLTLKDIAKIIGKQERQAKSIVKDLIANGLLKQKTDGYFLDRKYILRGKEMPDREEICDSTSQTLK